MDSNYWKNAYRDTWDMSAKRENAIIKWIADTTGLTAKSIGLGAGTKDFISGSADENGHQKGDADLLVVGTNIHRGHRPFVQKRAARQPPVVSPR